MVKHKLKNSDFLSLKHLDGDDLRDFLEVAHRIKKEGTKGMRPLVNKAIALLFEKPSTRTRVSFEVAILRLGGDPIVLSGEELQIKRGETIEDTGRVLSRYVDGLVVRTFAQQRLEVLAQVATVPVINALTDECHPCQALADMLTIMEYKGSFEGLKLAYLGDGNNVCHSLMRACTKLGMEIAVATPPGKEPMEKIIEESRENSQVYGGKLVLLNDPLEAVQDADVVYTDVWFSMGKEAESEDDTQLFAHFQVNSELLRYAKPDAIVMHDLPAHRGKEITDEVIDGSRSAVWDQAENRLHAQIALLGMIFSG
ncbi:MAG: ornithine carbamoyltransferase [Actinomycetota bacterium]|nr:ornithine carbamoyltransferase [Actinomycetota bacterium]